MGMNATTYVGPYLRIKAPKKGLDLVELTDERLCDLLEDDRGVLTPNVGGFGRSYDRDDSGCFIEIFPEHIDTEMREFQKAFAADIENLKRYKPRVCWGVVRYWL